MLLTILLSISPTTINTFVVICVLKSLGSIGRPGKRSPTVHRIASFSHNCNNNMPMATSNLRRSLMANGIVSNKRRFLLFLRVLLFMTMMTSAAAQLCETVGGNSWSGLTDALDRSYGFAILCPFHISGNGCPQDEKGYKVKEAELYIMCDSMSQSLDGGESVCLIDCPGAHFTVMPGSSLTLDGITLKGSKSSAIQVKPQGYLTTYNSVFAHNRRDSGNGAAIDAAERSNLSLMYSRFENNQALNGGAVYHLGAAVVSGSSFIDNHATVSVCRKSGIDFTSTANSSQISHNNLLEQNGGGGAIFSGAQARMDLSENLFAGNEATFFGPALFDGSPEAQSHQERNSACDNTIGGNSNVKCNGIYSIENGVGSCETFDDECIAPTAAPTASPSEVPSFSHTNKPSAQPSLPPTVAPTTSPTTSLPSSSPSLRPTSAPSKSVGPSMSPSDDSSSTPSFSPTTLPTAVPTTSLSPSQTPTLAPTVTSSPSQLPSLAPSTVKPSSFPSKMPSTEPSMEPSSSTTPTNAPTLSPSESPSAVQYISEYEYCTKQRTYNNPNKKSKRGT